MEVMNSMVIQAAVSVTPGVIIYPVENTLNTTQATARLTLFIPNASPPIRPVSGLSPYLRGRMSHA